MYIFVPFRGQTATYKYIFFKFVCNEKWQKALYTLTRFLTCQFFFATRGYKLSFQVTINYIYRYALVNPCRWHLHFELYILLSRVLLFFHNLVTITNAINAFLLIGAQRFIWNLYPVNSMEIFNNPQKI